LSGGTATLEIAADLNFCADAFDPCDPGFDRALVFNLRGDLNGDTDSKSGESVGSLSK
jgi:hypothetical protein